MATATSTAPTTVTPIQPRVPNTTICLPICYGSIAFPLVKTEEYNTHRWTIYVRGPNNEDLSHGIAKVVFQLHPSFPQPVREVTAPPFEVTEKGWGEFEVSIRIVWRDASEKALVLTHMLKLYPPLETTASSGSNVKQELEDGGGASSNEDGKKEIQVEGEVKLDPVKSEVYDEVVFTDPTETFHRQLTQATISGNIPLVTSQEPAVQKYLLPYSDEDDFKCLLEAQKFLENELMVVKDRILRADCAANELDAAMMEVLAKAKSIPVPPPAAASSTAPASTSAGTKRKKPSGGGAGSKKKKTVPSTSSNTPNSTAAAAPAPTTTTTTTTSAAVPTPTTTTSAAAPTPTTTTAVPTPAPANAPPTATSSSKPTTE